MVRTVAALTLVLVVFVPFVAADGDVTRLADYEAEDGRTACEGGFTEIRKDGAAVGKAHLRWEIPGGTDAARVWTRLDETDIRPFGVLRFRYRLKRPFDGLIWVGLRSEKGAIEATITEPSDGWRTLEISLAGMWKHADFDPAKVRWIEFHTFRSDHVQFDVDEVELVRTEGGWRGAGAGKEGFRYTVADYEGGPGSEIETTEWCRQEIVEEDGGHVLRLTPQGRHAFLSAHIGNVPEDLRPFRLARLRARVVWGSGRGIEFRILSSGGALEADLPELSEEWRTIEIPLPEMEMAETFNPRSAAGIHLVAFSNAKRVVEVDDVELVVSGTGWRYSAKELIERGLQDFAPVKQVADFESPAAATRVEFDDCEVARVPVKKKRGNGTGFALKWTVPEEVDKASIVLRQIPRNLSDYRILRFVARADRKTDADVQVRLESVDYPLGGIIRSWSDGGSLAFDIEGFDRNWKTIELQLPEAHRLGSFNAANVTGLRISRSGGLTVYFDRFELVKGGGGCLHTDRQEIARRFGGEGKRKVHEITTKHFRIFTDVERPDRKLGKKLESILDRARKELRLPEPVGAVCVWIHAERDAWADPLLRKSWTVHQLAAMAGFARAGSLCTWHQDYAAEPFVRELTRAIVQRSAGSGGGDWLQQGAAAFVAARFAGRSPADDYRGAVKRRQRRPLVDLLVHPRLPAEQRAMAAAFVEFLYRGPRAEQTVRGLSTLVLLDPRAPAFLEALEETLGAPVGDLDEEFRAWLDAGEEE
ncbi:MAG: hypothetical protein ABFS86_05835 [Planctomycetota bacterium]